MNDTKLLLGSLSNDLYRCACLIERGSLRGARRFLDESKRWTAQLKNYKAKKYIKNIIKDIDGDIAPELNMETAEKYLMYSVLLQNYTVHFDE